MIVSSSKTSQSGIGSPLASRAEKESSSELPGDGRKVAPLNPIENDHDGGTRSAGNGPEALTRSADVGGIRNAEDMARFDGMNWEVRLLDNIGGAEVRAHENVERKMGTKRTRGVMDIIRCLEYISITDDTMSRRRHRR